MGGKEGESAPLHNVNASNMLQKTLYYVKMHSLRCIWIATTRLASTTGNKIIQNHMLDMRVISTV
jgi:hypothetical protein